MSVLVYGVIAIVAVGIVYLMVRVGTFLKFRGKRLVTCPETNKPAAVELDAKEASRNAFLHEPPLQLQECSRWPERRDCGQECLSQIERAPEDCLVRNIVIRWFRDKKCVYCGKPLHEVSEWWVDHKPALLMSDRRTLAWDQVRAEQLPELFAACAPVCWSCSATETFRREHPELVTDRAPTDLRVRHIK